MSNIEKFISDNKIDLNGIANMNESYMYDMYELNPIALRYAVYRDPVMSAKSIADIVGAKSEASNYNKENVAQNLSLYFSEGQDKIDSYNNRSDGMLDYNKDNVISGLYESFNKEPMVITELDDAKSIITENGMHRYHVLRTFYLNELLNAKSDAERNALKKKYTVPVKIERIDFVKTYCNFMFALTGTNYSLSIKRDSNRKQTDNASLVSGGKEYILNDDMLINVVLANIDRIRDRSSIINTYCNQIPSFKDFITTYFPELLSRQR